jgi:hypothetical protein
MIPRGSSLQKIGTKQKNLKNAKAAKYGKEGRLLNLKLGGLAVKNPIRSKGLSL